MITPLITARFLLTSIFFIKITHQSTHCPKICICDEQNFETKCDGNFGASGIPHTLNPNTKSLTVNNAKTTQFSGIDYLSDLEILNLAHNKLTSIDFKELTKNTKLRSINSSHNNIVELRDTSITEAILVSLGLISSTSFQDDSPNDQMSAKHIVRIGVVELFLDNNHLVAIRNFTFIRMTRLQRLDLSHNSISYLESQSLIGLSNIESINLRGNRLTQVPTTALHSTILSPLDRSSNSATSQIKLLDLGENEFPSIGPDSFALLDKTQELYMDSCSIENIHERAFKGLHTLYLLSLDNNTIQQVPSKAFSYLGLLRSLKMNVNNLTILEPDCFSNLVNLEELQLNNGSFNQLEKGVFSGLNSLRRLEIANNTRLSFIEDGTFEDLNKLTYLSLHSNSLSSLPNDFRDAKSLSVLDLRSNNLFCGCPLKWLSKWLNNFNSSVTQIQLTKGTWEPVEGDVRALLMDSQLTTELLNLTCMGPPALSGKAIIALPDNKLECLEPSSDLNVHIGFGLLFLITFLLVFVCMINLCKGNRDLLLMLKDNFHKNLGEFKGDGQIYDGDYESVGYTNQTSRVYAIPDYQVMYHGSNNQVN